LETITARVPEALVKDLKRIEGEERTERAEVIRRLLAEAIADWKLRKALQMVRERKASMRAAAKFAGIRYLELLDRVEKEAVPLDYTLSDLRADVEGLKRERSE
jgi:predicted HTH domain antitoxin